MGWRGKQAEADGVPEGEEVLVNADVLTGVSPYTPVEEFLVPPHYPHWHKQTFDFEFFSDCWRPVVAVDGEYVNYTACGNRKFNFMMLKYRIDANVWEVLYTNPEGILYCCELEGGAAIQDPVYVFHNWCEDVEIVNGNFLLPVLSGGSLRTHVIDNTTGVPIHYEKQWTSTHKIPGRNKVACRADGFIAVIIEDDTNWEVQVSDDFGQNWIVKKQIAYSANRLDSGILIDENDDIYIFYYDLTGETITCERSQNDGDTWNTQGTISTVLTGLTLDRLEVSVDGSSLYVSAEDTLPGAFKTAEFYYSEDAGASWTTRTLPTQRLLFMAEETTNNLYNMDDELEIDQFTEDYTDTAPEFIDAAGAPDANGVIVRTITDRGYLKNSGYYGVHANRYSIFRAEGQGDYGAAGVLTLPGLIDSEGEPKQFVALWTTDDLGRTWRINPTPFAFHESLEDANVGFHDYRWPLNRLPITLRAITPDL